MSLSIRLEPIGALVDAAPGTPLRDLLFPYGVEFPCGGNGRCKRCKVRVLEGQLADAPSERILSAAEFADGWRLACHATVERSVVLDVGQWETAILGDESPVAFTPRPGHAIAVDLGTTTLVAQLVDLETGSVKGVRTALNPQAAYGSDVMSRIEHAIKSGGLDQLRDLIRAEIGRMARELAGDLALETVVIAGNTVMMHLFCGFDVEPLSHAPFEPQRLELQTIAGNPQMRFLPCPGGFVGSDILAGIVATDIHERDELSVLVDLGTNGEVVVGNRERILCASTAAGPAFEGGRIGCGMRAATGAISEVHVIDGRWECRVIGRTPPRGICGSGLVDAVAVGLATGAIRPNGRMSKPLHLTGNIVLTQADIREVQLAKGAIAAGIRVLLTRWGATPDDIGRVYLAGAFGNYINRDSAHRLGMIEFPPELVEPAGNTALLGTKLSLFRNEYRFEDLLARIQHVPLGADPEFQDTFVDCMSFPPAG
jgi:uncharacterized 2Fe-2S/4Fe-4S cluster protein (DUF4445 family)